MLGAAVVEELRERGWADLHDPEQRAAVEAELDVELGLPDHNM